jgi:hypothetical protein
MALTEPIKSFLLQPLPGMNNLREDLDLKDKWVSLAQNCRFEPQLGAVDKRDPVTYYNSSSTGAGPVVGVHRFYTSTGTIKFVKVHGTTAYVGDDAAGTWTAIRTSLTQGKRAVFETYKDLLYVSNGFDDIFVYDGSADNVTWEMGSCKAVLGSGAGLLDQDTYSYRITFDSDAVVNGATSNTVTCDVTDQQIELSNIPLGPTGTTNRKIYRTNGGGSSYFLIDELLDNTTTVYTDNIADSDTTVLTTGTRGDAYPTVTDDMPKGTILKIHRERLFVTGDPNSPSKIYYSAVFFPHYIQQTTNQDFLEISPEDGDEIMGIPIQLGVMVCIKKNTIRKLHVTAANSGANPETWYADDPLSYIGSPCQYSITQTPYGIVFLGWDHWYLFDGGTLKEVIQEFDTKQILPSTYQDVVGFYHKGVMHAAYSDLTIAAQFHNRIMRYNFRREKLGIDLWTSTTLSGANCFASKSGDDETGELYYGDSQNGYVVKEKESEEAYRLRTKTEANEGLAQANTTGVFVGGTENAPYIEIGSVTAAVPIADDVIIFWDNDTTTPGAGWTEITATYDGRFIVIDDTPLTLTAASSHTHTISGTLATVSPPIVNTGDQGSFGNLTNHAPYTHTFSFASSGATPEPRYIKLRVFKSSSATTTEFPDGAIVMYDQAETPTGFENLGNVGYYVKIGSTDLNNPVSSSHNHSFSGSSTSVGPAGAASGAGSGARGPHSHSISGSTSSTLLDSWELTNISLHMIKKVSEADTWDGSNKLVYALTDGAVPTGWTAVTTWDGEGRFLKVGDGVATTGEASGSSHTHTVTSGTSGTASALFGDAGNDRTLGIDDHTHPFTGSAGSGTANDPASVTFTLISFVLGKMKDYNAAIESSLTAGTWEAPAQQINAEAMSKLFWNEDIDDVVNDDIIFHTRSGATQAACEAAAYSVGLTDPNGSDIATGADIWFQYKIEFTAADTQITNPRVFFANAYVVRYTYEKGDVVAETSVNFVYDIGFREFDSPMQDKFVKKFNTIHQGTDGSFEITWKTLQFGGGNTDENTATFNVSLDTFPIRWESYFQDTAIGREISFTIMKNDLNEFRLSELTGVYSEYPALL